MASTQSARGPAPVPGWYPDPQGSGVLRWWDGATWTDHRAPAWQPQSGEVPVDHTLDWLLPTNRDGFAIASGYLGLFSLVPNPITSIAAVICGWIALGRIKRTGTMGRGRAIFGIIMGALSFGFFAFVMIMAVHST
jgi:hypothetical protein